ncbi:hypothetical protein Avbf_17041 [Armadillidium vulgare]|nr:hypothetical protein Avbf_17041 [Armadillidium vulgare]
MNFMQTRSTSYESDLHNLQNKNSTSFLPHNAGNSKELGHMKKKREREFSVISKRVLKCKSSQGKKNSQSFCFFIKIISKEEIGSIIH